MPIGKVTATQSRPIHRPVSLGRPKSIEGDSSFLESTLVGTPTPESPHIEHAHNMSSLERLLENSQKEHSRKQSQDEEGSINQSGARNVFQTKQATVSNQGVKVVTRQYQQLQYQGPADERDSWEAVPPPAEYSNNSSERNSYVLVQSQYPIAEPRSPKFGEQRVKKMSASFENNGQEQTSKSLWKPVRTQHTMASVGAYWQNLGKTTQQESTKREQHQRKVAESPHKIFEKPPALGNQYKKPQEQSGPFVNQYQYQERSESSGSQYKPVAGFVNEYKQPEGHVYNEYKPPERQVFTYKEQESPNAYIIKSPQPTMTHEVSRQMHERRKGGPAADSNEVAIKIPESITTVVIFREGRETRVNLE